MFGSKYNYSTTEMQTFCCIAKNKKQIKFLNASIYCVHNPANLAYWRLTALAYSMLLQHSYQATDEVEISRAIILAHDLTGAMDKLTEAVILLCS